VQITAIAVGLTAILLLTMIRGDLLDAWRGRLPPDAPDRFLVNIQPEQREALSEFLDRERREAAANLSHGARAPGRHQRKAPWVRGLFGGAREAPDRARVQPDLPRRVADRQQDHRGRVVRPADLARGAISVEHWIAERFGVRIGTRWNSFRGPWFFRAGHERAQARLGLDAPEFLFHRYPGAARRLPRELHRELFTHRPATLC